MWAEIRLSRGNRHHSQLNERNRDRVNRGAELPLGLSPLLLPQVTSINCKRIVAVCCMLSYLVTN
jgi:hypothetical protein